MKTFPGNVSCKHTENNICLRKLFTGISKVDISESMFLRAIQGDCFIILLYF